MSAPEVNPLEKSRSPRVKLFIALAVVALAVGYLIVSSVRETSAYYMTINELQAAGTAVQNKKLRVAGTLVENSAQWNPQKLMLNFTLTDKGNQQLPVSYKGARPDMFKDGTEVIVEGTYTNGDFQASNLLLKCPSKYQDAATSQAQK